MPRKRKNRNFIAYPVESTLTLAALAAGGIVSDALTALGVTEAYLISADLTWALKGATQNEGPIRVGVANGQLSNTEISENLNARPTGPGDIVAIAEGRRPVRQVGKFSLTSVSEVLADGKPIRTKLRFPIGEGQELDAWATNEGTATLTTGITINVSGTLYLRWN